MSTCGSPWAARWADYCATQYARSVDAGLGSTWGTVAINVIGCFVIGWFGTLTLQTGALSSLRTMRAVRDGGICGGFTTFSAFSLQTFDLFRSGEDLARGVEHSCVGSSVPGLPWPPDTVWPTTQCRRSPWRKPPKRNTPAKLQEPASTANLNRTATKSVQYVVESLRTELVGYG